MEAHRGGEWIFGKADWEKFKGESESYRKKINDNMLVETVRNRNETFQLLRRTPNFQHLIQFKKAQALVRKVIKEAKRRYWRDVCDTIWNATPVGEV